MSAISGIAASTPQAQAATRSAQAAEEARETKAQEQAERSSSAGKGAKVDVDG